VGEEGGRPTLNRGGEELKHKEEETGGGNASGEAASKRGI